MALGMISNMASIKANYFKSQLIESLVKFREQHRKEYSDAVEVYQKDVVDALKKLIARTEGDPNFKEFSVSANLGLTTPVNCEKEYDQLITVFKAMNTDVIELNLEEANRILNNDWAWIVSASASNTFYSSRKR